MHEQLSGRQHHLYVNGIRIRQMRITDQEGMASESDALFFWSFLIRRDALGVRIRKTCTGFGRRTGERLMDIKTMLEQVHAGQMPVEQAEELLKNLP